MSTTPSVPASTPTTPAAPASTATAAKPAATSTAQAVSNGILAHHPIIKLAIVAGLIWALSGRAINAWANHEQHVFDSKNAALAAQVKENQTQAEQNAAQAAKDAALAAQYQALAAQVQKQNAALAAQNTSLAASLTKQQATDATLAPAALAERWAQLVPGAQVTPTAEGYTLTNPSATATVSQLERVPVLQDELSNTSAAKLNDDKQIAAQEAVTNGLNDQIAGLNKQAAGLAAQNADEVKTCAAQVANVKVQAHKTARRRFLEGAATGAGVITGLVIKFLL